MCYQLNVHCNVGDQEGEGEEEEEDEKDLVSLLITHTQASISMHRCTLTFT